ncbi:MAG: replicative DNA helicase [Odoribacter sp.]
MKNQSIQTSIDGLVQPQAVDIEKYVLGSLMVDRDSIVNVIGILNIDCFYLPVHRVIYDKILNLYKENQPIDLLTVVTGLMTNEVLKSSGGVAYLSDLTSLSGGCVNIVKHAQILAQKQIAREIIRLCSDIRLSAFDEINDVADVVEDLNDKVRKINELVTGKTNIHHISDSVEKAMKECENRQLMASKNIIPGIDTGLYDLNVITGGGWKSSQLIVIAARPAMGKTALLLHFAKSAARSGKSVCIYSLEMSDISLANRLLLSECDIDTDRFKAGRLTDNELASLNQAAGVIWKLPIYVDANPCVSMDYIRGRSKIMADKGQCDMILVDYLQLAEMGKGERNRNREQEVAQASRMAKIIAKEMNVPFILLSQLSRGVESRVDKRPMLSDLRESGAIEQDADSVMFIYRPAYYKVDHVTVKNENGYGTNEISTNGLGILCIEKQRDGATGTVKFSHNPNMTQICDYGKNEQNPF